MIILGVDPGLNATGYGITEGEPDGRLRILTAGDIRPSKTEPLAQRLAVIHGALSQLIRRYHPDAVVLETLFTHHRHVTTAALMAHARGMACLAAQEHAVPVAEYPPTQVRKSLVGNGAASKAQVARMVGHWVRDVDPSWSADATDALALAIVHARVEAQRQKLPAGVV